MCVCVGGGLRQHGTRVAGVDEAVGAGLVVRQLGEVGQNVEGVEVNVERVVVGLVVLFVVLHAAVVVIVLLVVVVGLVVVAVEL